VYQYPNGTGIHYGTYSNNTNNVSYYVR
ncbi:hypothetical protein EHRUM3_12050, partial [Ehrlichia ruminantium]